MKVFPSIALSLPEWLGDLVPAGGITLSTVEARMEWVVRLSRLNVEQGTGGPFGAAIFESSTGRLIAPGVNLVVPAACSVAHAEMVAIMLAQKVLGSFDLGGEGQPVCELVASTEPCAMCLGAIPWSGVRKLVCGARKEDAEAYGFDEGDRPVRWIDGLGQRGIEVVCDVAREQASGVLQQYVELGGMAYNGRLGDSPG